MSEMPDCRVCTVATGEQYQALAALTVPLMEQRLGKSVEVISAGDPWEQKLSLLESGESVLFIDADMVVQGWAWESFDANTLNIVPYPNTPGAYRSVDTGAQWFCSGIWYAPASYAHVFALAKSILQAGTRVESILPNLREEAALNLAIQDLQPTVTDLDRSYNSHWLASPRAGARCVHYVGMEAHHKLELVAEHIAQLNG